MMVFVNFTVLNFAEGPSLLWLFYQTFFPELKRIACVLSKIVVSKGSSRLAMYKSRSMEAVFMETTL
jgi:hypothetical protein